MAHNVEGLWTRSVEDDRKWLAENTELDWDSFEETSTGENVHRTDLSTNVEEEADDKQHAERVVASAQVCAYELEGEDDIWKAIAGGEWMTLYLVEQSSTKRAGYTSLRLAAVDPATGGLAIATPIGRDAELVFADADGEQSSQATSFGELSCGTLDTSDELPLFGLRFGDVEQGQSFSAALKEAAKLLHVPKGVETRDEAKDTLVAMGFDEMSIDQALKAVHGVPHVDLLANWIIEHMCSTSDDAAPTEDDDDYDLVKSLFADVSFTQDAVSLAAWSLVRQVAEQQEDPDRMATSAVKLARQLLFDADKRRDKYWAWVAKRAAKSGMASSSHDTQAARVYRSIKTDVESRAVVEDRPTERMERVLTQEEPPPSCGRDEQSESSLGTARQEVLEGAQPPAARSEPASDAPPLTAQEGALAQFEPPPTTTAHDTRERNRQPRAGEANGSLPPPPSHQARKSGGSGPLRFKALTNAVSRVRNMMPSKKKKKKAQPAPAVSEENERRDTLDPMEVVERAMRRASGVPHTSHRQDEISCQPCQPNEFDAITLLGRGAFGAVVLARRRADSQIFAVKVLEKRRIVGQRAEAMARLERDILDQFSGRGSKHAFVARMRFAFQTYSKLYLAMDFYPNGSLHSVLKKDSSTRRHGRRAVKAVAPQLASALDHVHRACIIHRDVKPSNVLVDARGNVALSDFGLATRVQARGADLRKRSFVGTIDYAAPELLLKSSTSYNHVVDCWALGCLLFEMCAGQPPFLAPTTRDTFTRIVRAEPRWRSIVSLKDETRTTLQLLLQKDPRERLGANIIWQHPDTDWFDLVDNTAALAQQPPPLEAFLRDAKIKQPDPRAKDPHAAALFRDDGVPHESAGRLRNRSDAFGGFGRPPSVAIPYDDSRPTSTTASQSTPATVYV